MGPVTPTQHVGNLTERALGYFLMKSFFFEGVTGGEQLLLGGHVVNSLEILISPEK